MLGQVGIDQVAGRDVYDSDGDKIGRTDDEKVPVDDDEEQIGRVRYRTGRTGRGDYPAGRTGRGDYGTSEMSEPASAEQPVVEEEIVDVDANVTRGYN